MGWVLPLVGVLGDVRDAFVSSSRDVPGRVQRQDAQRRDVGEFGRFLQGNAQVFLPFVDDEPKAFLVDADPRDHSPVHALLDVGDARHIRLADNQDGIDLMKHALMESHVDRAPRIDDHEVVVPGQQRYKISGELHASFAGQMFVP